MARCPFGDADMASIPLTADVIYEYDDSIKGDFATDVGNDDAGRIVALRPAQRRNHRRFNFGVCLARHDSGKECWRGRADFEREGNSGHFHFRRGGEILRVSFTRSAAVEKE